MDPLFLGMSYYRRRQFEESISVCDEILRENSRDAAAMLLKTKSLTAMSFVDDADMEELGVAELLLDDDSTATVPRPGTSINKPSVSRRGGWPDQGIRPMSATGRPVTGFVSPGTLRPLSRQMTVETAFKGSRPGSSRPATTLGREVRLATASLAMDPDRRSIDTTRLNLARLAMRPPLAIAIAEYLLYHEVSPRRALDLAAECTNRAGFKDWWWKLVIGRCYYKLGEKFIHFFAHAHGDMTSLSPLILLGLYREAERQFKSSIKDQDMVVTHLDLCKVYLRLDIPQTALKHLADAR